MKLFVGVLIQAIFVVSVWGSVSQELDPKVIIDKYNSYNKTFDKIYYDLETTLDSMDFKDRKDSYLIQYCSNTEKKQWLCQRKLHNNDGTVDQLSSGLLRNIYNDKLGINLQLYNPELENAQTPMAILQKRNLEISLQNSVEFPPYGGSLTGRSWGSEGKSIGELLESGTNLTLHKEITKIIGYDTYLIEGETKYGNVKAWIAPDLGYNCLKWENIKSKNQYYRDGLPTNDWYSKVTAMFDAEKVEQIDGKYIVTQAKYEYRADDGNKVIAHDKYRFDVKNVNFKPDFEALKAFEIQLPEGTEVIDLDAPGVYFKWIEGKLQPVFNKSTINVIDSTMEDLLKNRDIISKEQSKDSKTDSNIENIDTVESKQLPDRGYINVKKEEKNILGMSMKNFAGIIITTFLIIATVLFIYRNKEKVVNNEK